MTDVIRVDADHPDPQAIAHAADVLRRGGLVAFPTETVYGLGANALDRAAVRRVFAAKGRPSDDPLIVHVASPAAIEPLVAAVPDTARALARFWPGPLTLVLPRSPAVPDEVTAGLDTVAVRMPAHPVARALLHAAQIPIAAPSANLFSRPSPTTAEHVLHDLRDRIDLVLDGGPTTVGIESTVLDLSGPVPVILRPGAVTPAMLQPVIGRVEIGDGSRRNGSGPQRSPGLLAKHYAPRAPMTLFEGSAEEVIRCLADAAEAALRAGLRVGIVAADEDLARLPSRALAVSLGPAGDSSTAAGNLYAVLRQLDDAGVDIIFARAFPAADGLGLAIRDRLRRAAVKVVACP